MQKRRTLSVLLLGIALTATASADLVLRLDAANLPAGPLSNWSDSSGNGFDAGQATAANQPSVVNGGGNFNNLNVVQFTGNDGANSDYLFNTAVNYDARTAISVFRVNSSLRSTSQLGQIWGQYASNVAIHVAADFRSTGRWSFDGDTSGGNGSQARYSLDGSAFSTATAGNAALPWATDNTHLVTAEFTSTDTLDEHYIGALIPKLTIAQHAFGGEIAEILVFDDVLTADERTGLEHLVAERWGLTGPANANPAQIAAANALFPSGFYSIPEPSSLALALLGLATILPRIRKRFVSRIEAQI